MCKENVCVDGVIFNVKSGIGTDCKHKNSDMCDLCEVNLSDMDNDNNDNNDNKPIIRW